MSKEEFLKIQNCVLRVNIHCDGCKLKVKKILQKIDGIFTISIDSEQGKVIVTGNVDPAVMIKKLTKAGKHAELWAVAKPGVNHNNVANQLKNMHLDSGKVGGKCKGQKAGNNQPKTPQQLHQIQQLQQMGRVEDLKLPQKQEFKKPSTKSVKFACHEEEDEFSDDEFDEFDEEDDDEEDDGDGDDEFEHGMMGHHLQPPNKLKPNSNGNNVQFPHAMVMNGLPPQAMPGSKGRANVDKMGGVHHGGPHGVSGGGGGGCFPGQVNMGRPHEGKGTKKGGGDLNPAQGGRNGGNGGGGGNKNGGGSNKNGGSNNSNGVNNCGNKRTNGGGAGVGTAPTINNGHHQGFNGPLGPSGPLGNMRPPNMGPIGNPPMGGPMGHHMPAVPGLPAGASSFNGPNIPCNFEPGPEPMQANPYQQQQYLAALMNQQRAMGNDKFQPMMYRPPVPPLNYMPPYPYPYPCLYPYPHPNTSDSYSSYFSDENASSCNVM